MEAKTKTQVIGDVWEYILFEYPTLKDEYIVWIKDNNLEYDVTENVVKFLIERDEN